ncbi:polyketide cyclase (plasmid) [Frondihabitans sp. PAMC 28766]|uniref:SRPBCC family protein n=1 Tax=Frondihabitans sp. PAMC 28766 TaxID=1795630 RepID=UPI00078EBA99|nr:SRPBCC family protein [Frondihabitans sp. PAMC 28766]AMM22752.1 polyketide cyclase [Frondihabitans sp. PAMC 28766]
MATNYRLIKATPEAVFRVLVDGWLFPSWVVGASRIRDVDASWPDPDSKLHHSFGVWPLVIDDTTSSVEWDPPHHATFQARGWPIGEAEVTIDIQTRQDGCVVRMHEDAARGPGRLVPKPVRDIGLLIRNREALQRLAWLAEGH